MASTGGNLMQRTRCAYFYDVATPCNKREPGTGCSAIGGINRMHAILGASEACIADSSVGHVRGAGRARGHVHVAGPAGTARLRSRIFTACPRDTPHLDTNLHPHEMITAIELPAAVLRANSRT